MKEHCQYCFISNQYVKRTILFSLRSLNNSAAAKQIQVLNPLISDKSIWLISLKMSETSRFCKKMHSGLNGSRVIGFICHKFVSMKFNIKAWATNHCLQRKHDSAWIRKRANVTPWSIAQRRCDETLVHRDRMIE